MTASRWRPRPLVPTGLAILIVMATAGTVAAFNPQPEPPGRGVLAVTETQALDLTAVNLADRGDCEVQFEFRDVAGRTLATDTMFVAPGAFATLEFVPPDPVQPSRVHVRGVVTPLSQACELATTLEVFDRRDGRTTVAVGDVGVGD